MLKMTKPIYTATFPQDFYKIFFSGRGDMPPPPPPPLESPMILDRFFHLTTKQPLRSRKDCWDAGDWPAAPINGGSTCVM